MNSQHRSAKVFYDSTFAGIYRETDAGYEFQYDHAYLKSSNPQAVSLALPLQSAPYKSRTMIPFFDGLIPEGWLLNIATDTWKISRNDRMGLMLNCCRDCIGAVHIEAWEENDDA